MDQIRVLGPIFINRQKKKPLTQHLPKACLNGKKEDPEQQIRKELDCSTRMAEKPNVNTENIRDNRGSIIL